MFGRLVPFGFQRSQGGYEFCETVLDGVFEVRVHVTADGEMSTHVINTDSNEGYLAIHVAQAMGNFVGQVGGAYPVMLERVTATCFEALPSLNPQTNRLTHYLQATYGDMYDHPFEKYPEFSSYRYPQNHRWYALTITVARGKLDLGDETWSRGTLEQKIEIINIKVKPKDLPRLPEISGICPSYHMSKKSWVSLVLDETVSDGLLFSLVESSRALVAGKSLRSLSGPDYWIIPANLKYYDVDAEFTANSITNWTQKTSIKAGGYVAIYITAPTCALRCLCHVLESDIPNSGYREEKSIKKLIKVESLQTSSDNQFPIAVLKECGVTDVRGSRRVTKELITLIDSNIES